MNISQRLRTCARHTGLDAVIELLNEAADEIDRLSARQPAEVTGLLEAFDDAVSQELPRVSHVEYDSHEICKHFASKVRAILALRPERVPMTGDQWTDVLGSAGPDLLDLAKQWADNKVHVYQVVNEAEKIVKAAVLRGINAQAKKETP